MSAGLQGAIESAPVTRLHEYRSYDPADFGVPDGREEEWRFTPLRRLRGLHTDTPPAPTGTVTVEVDPAPEVKTFSAERAVANAGRTFIPADRVSAQAYASFDRSGPSRFSAQRMSFVSCEGCMEAIICNSPKRTMSSGATTCACSMRSLRSREGFTRCTDSRVSRARRLALSPIAWNAS